MTNTLVQFRVDEKLKNEASKVYEDLGLDLSSAVKLFFRKTIKMKRIPFSINDDEVLEDEIRKKCLKIICLALTVCFATHDEVYNMIKK